jgi:peptidoglycan/LPS O-acetylase OafA/YrhL
MGTQDAVRSRDSYFPQIDFVKALAIVAVIALHTLSARTLTVIFAQFHIWQAVPVFFILMGITSTISFVNKKQTTLLQVYSPQYFVNRFWRIIIPFSVAFMVSLCYGIWRGSCYVGWQWFVGLLPVSGPGNYFVTILVQYIVVAPLILILYLKSPKVAIVILFAIDIAFQLLAPHIPVFESDPYLYSACILRYFSALGLGFYVAREFLNKGRIELADNRFILVLLPVSVVYLFIGRWVLQPFPLFLDAWGTQNVISFFYPLMLIILAFNNWQRIHLDRYGRLSRAWLKIGEASYHIFLVQMLFFGFGLSFLAGSSVQIPVIHTTIMHVPCLSQLAGVVANLVCITCLGMAFYLVEGRVSRLVRSWALVFR